MMTGQTLAASGLASGMEIGGDGGGGDGGGGDAGAIKIFNLKPTYSPSPDYPRHSLRNGEQGVVVLLVKVGIDGTPIEATILKSSGFKVLDENTKQHIVRKWRFQPAMRQGVPIPAYVLAKQIYNINEQFN